MKNKKEEIESFVGHVDEKIKVILWDFDGVIMNSNEIRNSGFEEVLKNYPQEEVSELMAFHKRNGGLSRYVKFRFFFEEIRNEVISDFEIQEWAKKFSSIMLNKLKNKNLLIKEVHDFIRKNHKKYKMHIVSGSDQSELRNICSSIGISEYFLSIQGSPTPKTNLVKGILTNYLYKEHNTVLIGDSINDYEAAKDNEIEFLGYNYNL